MEQAQNWIDGSNFNFIPFIQMPDIFSIMLIRTTVI